MKTFFLSLVLIGGALLFSGCETANDFLQDSELTDEEIVEGLKEALKVGTDTSTATLAKEDGYYQDLAVRILLPTELQTSIAGFRAKSITYLGVTVTGEQLYNGYSNPLLGINIPGLKSKEQELIKGINRAAEDAAKNAGPIFIDAITDITIEDGFNILFGGDSTAATTYLRSKTEAALFAKYEPKIEASLQTVKIGNTSVVDEYEEFVQSYNNILTTGLGNTTIGQLAGVNTVAAADLSVYSTNRGLDGLFLKVSEEESDIRNNPLARVNAILQKVFGELDN